MWRRTSSVNPSSFRVIEVDPKAAVLAECECFRHLSRKELQAAARQFDAITVPAGTVLVQEEARNETLWLIAEGHVSVSLRGRALREHGRGELIGLPTMLDGGVAGVSATAFGLVTALVASKQQFAALISNPTVELALRQTSARRVRRDFLALVSMTRGQHRLRLAPL
jgi:CRP-like cAMP-binding protein